MEKRTRNKQMIFRFTLEEYEKIQKKISSSKLNRADFLIACVDKKPIIIIDNLNEIIAELKHQGNNLNQIAKSLNENQTVNTTDIAEAIKVCNKTIAKLYQLSIKE